MDSRHPFCEPQGNNALRRGSWSWWRRGTGLRAREANFIRAKYTPLERKKPGLFVINSYFSAPHLTVTARRGRSTSHIPQRFFFDIPDYTPFPPTTTSHTSFTMASQLRLGSIAPDFEAETTAGPIKFHDFIGDSWCADPCTSPQETFANSCIVPQGRPLLPPRRLHARLHHRARRIRKARARVFQA